MKKISNSDNSGDTSYPQHLVDSFLLDLEYSLRKWEANFETDHQCLYALGYLMKFAQSNLGNEIYLKMIHFLMKKIENGEIED